MIKIKLIIKSNFPRVRTERGSISLVVITLFLISVFMILIATDVASVAIAKRSLTQATESAAQRGVRNLDKSAYYLGEFDVSTQVENLFGLGPSDPGIPIDCSKALDDVRSALADWSNGKASLRRIEIIDVAIESIECDGFGVELVTSARSVLPMQIPFFAINQAVIYAKVAITNKRKGGFSPFGIRVS